MQLIATRKYSPLAPDTLEAWELRHALVRVGENEFFLYTTSAHRHRVSKRALIDYGGDKTPCTIRDLSATGAALEFFGLGAPMTAAFTLIIPEDKLKLPCRVVWRGAFKLTFD